MSVLIFPLTDSCWLQQTSETSVVLILNGRRLEVHAYGNLKIVERWISYPTRDKELICSIFQSLIYTDNCHITLDVINEIMQVSFEHYENALNTALDSAINTFKEVALSEYNDH